MPALSAMSSTSRCYSALRDHGADSSEANERVLRCCAISAFSCSPVTQLPLYSDMRVCVCRCTETCKAVAERFAKSLAILTENPSDAC